MTESKWRRNAAAPVLAGLTAGLVLLLASGNRVVIGAAIIVVALVALPLCFVKKWLTDTSYERERLRHATLQAEENSQLAQVARALQYAERERDRGLAEADRKEADRRVTAAQARIDQNEINTAMRAHAFEEACEKHYKEKLAAAVAAEQQRANEAIAAVKLEYSNNESGLKIGQFFDGVMAERNGEVDAILAAMEDPKLIHLDDHRRPGPDLGSASTGRG